jgi:protein gp37
MYREKEQYGQNPNVVVRSKTTFRDPLKWKEPKRIFTCSWSDFFIEEADAWRDEAWEIIQATPQHTYLILTKRPELIAGRLPWHRRLDHTAGVSFVTDQPWPNVHLGVSVESTEYLWRVAELLKVPAALHVISAEPLLGVIDLRNVLQIDRYLGKPDWIRSGWRPDIQWVIVGGESGPEARPTHPEWIESIIQQCAAAGVPCFVKQIGEWRPALWGPRDNRQAPWGTLDRSGNWYPETTPWNGRQGKDSDTGEYVMVKVGGHGDDPRIWPEQFRVRQFPPKSGGRLLDGRTWDEYPTT